MIGNRCIQIILVMACILFLNGCWNYREIEQMTIVQGLAIDQADGQFLITIESIAPKGGDAMIMEPDLTSAEGETIFDVVRNLIMTTGRRVYWSHAKVIIISEDIAREGITPVLDYVTRDAEMRENMWILLSREATAKTILEGKVKMHDTISIHLDDMMDAQKNISKYNAMELWRLQEGISAVGLSPSIPTVTMHRNKDEEISLAYGAAIFKKDRMVGWLNGIETRAMLLTRGELKGGLLVIPNVGKTNTDVTLEIFKSTTKLHPSVKNNELIMNIDVETEVNIADIAGTEDFISEPGRQVLTEDAEKSVKIQIEDTIRKVQKQWESDVFDFGGVVNRELPEYWKNNKTRWSEVFVRIKPEVNVNIKIRGSALTSKPVKLGD
jgi:spore germination protein KC